VDGSCGVIENSQEDGNFPETNCFALYMLILQVAYMYFD
jgi:hypothetical protein